MTKETLNNQIDKKNTDPRAKADLKSPKNMAGYAEDKEIDPKLLKVGELVREAQADEDAESYSCTDEDLMKSQEEKEKALAAQRMSTCHSNK